MTISECDLSTPVYSVSAFNSQIKELLEHQYGCVWLEGEISNFSQPKSGHWYFSLKDEHAQIRCAMFRFVNQRVAFTPEDGMAVKLRAKASLYCDRGEFQLIVDVMEAEGEGALQQAYEALKKKLQALGLFAPERKKPLPVWPVTIGIISSPTGAVIRDIITTLRRRYPLARVILYPTLVQGKQAAASIVAALALAHRHQQADVLVVARGGGSLEDLWAFNEESVVMAVANSVLPTVSAIGHETDFTLTDFVADMRAPTPTAAAELISPHLADWADTLEVRRQDLQTAILNHLQAMSQRCDYLIHRLQTHHPLKQCQHQLTQIQQWQHRLQVAMKHTLHNQQRHLQQVCAQLHLVSPLQTLARGYGIVQDEQGHVITDSKKVKPNDLIQISLHQGKIQAKVMLRTKARTSDL